MKPTHYKGDKDNCTFHYSFTDLRKFIEHGHKHGNNWMIITKKIGEMITYRGFGTIEVPVKKLSTFIAPIIKQLYDEFVIEDIMNTTDFRKWSTRVIEMDFSKYAEKHGHPEYYMEDEATCIDKEMFNKKYPESWETLFNKNSNISDK